MTVFFTIPDYGVKVEGIFSHYSKHMTASKRKPGFIDKKLHALAEIDKRVKLNTQTAKEYDVLRSTLLPCLSEKYNLCSISFNQKKFITPCLPLHIYAFSQLSLKRSSCLTSDT